MSRAGSEVQAVLERLVQDGPEIGLQVAAYLDGELVIDAWAGLIDPAGRRPVDGQTLFSASSTGKGIAATCIHLLAERGQIDFAAPVAQYWPEFGANGKEGVTVRDVLTHRAGVPYPPPGFDLAMLIDWDRMCQGIAQLPLSWPPGTKTGYHNYTFGFIVGELVRRIDGRPIARFLQEDVCRPLQIDSLFFGVPVEEMERVATFTAGVRSAPAQPPTPIVTSDYNRPEVRTACIPSSGMIVNARSLARHYALLAQGGALDGTRLLSAERIRAAARLQTDAMDEIYKVSVKRGLGYRLGDDTGPGAGAGALGHVGAAMFGYADPDTRFAIGFLKNYLDPTGGWAAAEAVFASIDATLHISQRKGH